MQWRPCWTALAGEREDWELTTISARQRQGRPAGLAWQWKVESLVESLSTIGYNPLQGKRLVDGFLYGRLDQAGEFTGAEITFLYPDLLTGIRGQGGRLSHFG